MTGTCSCEISTRGIEVQGQYSGGANQELFTIGEVDKVWLLGDLYEMDCARSRRGVCDGQRRRLSQQGVQGQGRLGERIPDPNTRTARVRCTFDNPDKDLRPEMYATVEISVDQRRALAIPRNAVLHYGDYRVAFIELEKRTGACGFTVSRSTLMRTSPVRCSSSNTVSNEDRRWS